MNSVINSFECFVNVLNSDTHCDSLTVTSSDSVVGPPMIGHDVFHEVANNLMRIAQKQNPDVIQDFIKYKIYESNPASFSFNGERLAMIAQDYVKAFSNGIRDTYTISCTHQSEIPTYQNINKLSSLLSFDIKSSFSISNFELSAHFHSQLLSRFMSDDVLTSIMTELVNTFSSSIYALYSNFCNAYYQSNPGYVDQFEQQFKRFIRSSINAQQLLESQGIISQKATEDLVFLLVDKVKLYLGNQQSRDIITDDQRIYSFYVSNSNSVFSLKKDIFDYYSTSTLSQSLMILEPEFILASNMDWEVYLGGSRFIANIFDSIYMSEFNISNITIDNNSIVLRTSKTLSLLEVDIAKYNNSCLALNSYNVTDFVSKTGCHQDTIRLRKEYNYIVGILIARINELDELCNQVLDDMDLFSKYSNEQQIKKEELANLKKLPSTRLITDQLIKYYGYCDLQ